MRKVLMVIAAVFATLSVNAYADGVDLNVISNAYVDLMAKGNYMDGPVTQAQRIKIIKEAHTLGEDKHNALESFVSDVANTGKNTGPEDTCHRAFVITALMSSGPKGPDWTVVNASGLGTHPDWAPSIKYVKTHPEFVNDLYEAFGGYNDGFYTSDMQHEEENCMFDLTHK